FKVYAAGAPSMQAYSYSKMGKTQQLFPSPCIFLLQVVEIVDRYDNVCVPSNMTSDKVAYIQNDDVDKTCSRTLKVVCPVLYRVLPSKDENRKRTEQLIVLT
ncbi:hypothetical protein BHE74_00023654, partial [Ensete ventricosum]